MKSSTVALALAADWWRYEPHAPLRWIVKLHQVARQGPVCPVAVQRATTPTVPVPALVASAEPVKDPVKPTRPHFFTCDPPSLDTVRRRARLTREWANQRRTVNPNARLMGGHTDRAALAYARHALTNYDALRRGKTPAECEALRRAVNESVVAVYPELRGAA